MISVIMCSADAAKFDRALQHYKQILGAEPFELVAIHDAQGLAEAYNRGVARSRGDVLIFSHDDVEFLTDRFRDRLLGHLGACDLLGLAGATKLISGRFRDAGLPYLYGQVATPNPRSGLIDVQIWGAPARRDVPVLQAAGCPKRAL